MCPSFVEVIDFRAINALKLLVIATGLLERLRVEELGRGRKFGGTNEVLEGNREAGFRAQPTLRDYRDIAVRRHGFKHGNSESQIVIVLIFRVSLSEDESVVEEDDFTVDIFDTMMNCSAPP